LIPDLLSLNSLWNVIFPMLLIQWFTWRKILIHHFTEFCVSIWIFGLLFNLPRNCYWDLVGRLGSYGNFNNAMLLIHKCRMASPRKDTNDPGTWKVSPHH
jgi:hypothetical protein